LNPAQYNIYRAISVILSHIDVAEFTIVMLSSAESLLAATTIDLAVVLEFVYLPVRGNNTPVRLPFTVLCLEYVISPPSTFILEKYESLPVPPQMKN